MFVILKNIWIENQLYLQKAKGKLIKKSYNKNKIKLQDLAAARRNLVVAMVMEQHMEQRHVDSDVAAKVMEQHKNRDQIMNKINKKRKLIREIYAQAIQDESCRHHPWHASKRNPNDAERRAVILIENILRGSGMPVPRTVAADVVQGTDLAEGLIWVSPRVMSLAGQIFYLKEQYAGRRD